VGQLPPEAIACTWHPDTLRLDLACRGFQAQLPGWNPEELPAPPGAGALPLTTLSASTLRTLVESVAYAAADDATKVLSNVLFHFHDQQLTLVGADGFRLVRRSTPLEALTLPAGAQTPDLQLLVPAPRGRRTRRRATRGQRQPGDSRDAGPDPRLAPPSRAGPRPLPPASPTAPTSITLGSSPLIRRGPRRYAC